MVCIINLERRSKKKPSLCVPYRWKFTQECFNVSYIHISFFIKLSFFFVSKSNFIIFFCTLEQIRGKYFCGNFKQNVLYVCATVMCYYFKRYHQKYWIIKSPVTQKLNCKIVCIFALKVWLNYSRRYNTVGSASFSITKLRTFLLSRSIGKILKIISS